MKSKFSNLIDNFQDFIQDDDLEQTRIRELSNKDQAIKQLRDQLRQNESTIKDLQSEISLWEYERLQYDS